MFEFEVLKLLKNVSKAKCKSQRKKVNEINYNKQRNFFKKITVDKLS